MPPRYLVDTSVLARSDRPTVRERLGPVLRSGQAATCGVIALEILYSARGPEAIAERRLDLAQTFANIDISESDFGSAKDLLQELAARGRHRSVGVADLVIASCAQRAGLALLHYDSDFDTIASVTGQPTEWVVPRGSVP